MESEKCSPSPNQFADVYTDEPSTPLLSEADIHSEKNIDEDESQSYRGLCNTFTSSSEMSKTSCQYFETSCNSDRSVITSGTVDTDKLLSHSSAHELRTNNDKAQMPPLIFGNINAANLLTLPLLNKTNPSCSGVSSSVYSLPPLLDSQVIGILPVPVFVQSSSAFPPASNNVLSQQSSTLLFTSPSSGNDSSTSSNFTSTVKRLHADSVMQCEPPAKAALTSALSTDKPDLSAADTVIINQQPVLSASDTVIINQPVFSASESDTIIISSSPSTTAIPDLVSSQSSQNNILHTVLAREGSSITSTVGKPCTLLSSISDRIVPLESIPTVSLFKPDTSGQCNNEASKTADLLNDTSQAIIGHEHIPQPIFLCLNQHKEPSMNTQQIQTVESGICKERDGMHIVTPAIVKKELDVQTESAEASETRTCEILDADTHMGVDNEAIDVEKCSQKQGSLTRSDTIIINKEKNSSEHSNISGLSSSDTVILPTEPRKDSSDGQEKLSEGFSLNSMSTLSALSTGLPSLSALSDSSINESFLLNALVNSAGQTLSFLNQQITSPQVLNKSSSAKHPSSLMVLCPDGQLKRLDSDNVNVIPTNQFNVLQNISSNPQRLLQNLYLSSADVSGTRNMCVKGTQTDMVLGNAAIQFTPVDTVGNGQNALGGISVVSSTVPLQTTNIPVTVLISGEPLNEQTVQNETLPQQAVTPHCEPGSSEQVVAVPVSGEQQSLDPAPAEVPQEKQPRLTRLSKSRSRNSHVCMECGRIFRTPRELEHHQKIHKKVFKCDLCTATFTRPGNYTRHRKIHNLQPENQNSNQCSYCNREFLQRCDLKRHLLIHTKQEPHRCEQCGKGYIRRSDLVVHMRFHNKEKLFKCELCDKSFFQSGDLKRHVRRAHEPSSQLTCGHCERKYACETTLIRHMKATHKDIILQTVNQKLKLSEAADGVIKNKDVLFTMTESDKASGDKV